MTKPPYERLLQGADAQQAQKLQQEINSAYGAGDDASLVNASQQLLEQRQRVQGIDHWETIDAKWLLDLRQQFAALPAEGQAAWRSGAAGTFRAISLDDQGL